MATNFALSSQQIADYHRDGYLMVPGLFAGAEADLLKRVGSHDPRIVGARAMNDREGGQSKIWLSMGEEETVYAAFSHSARVGTPMTQLLDGPIYLWHHKMMLKEPFVGGAWEWHQDYGYWYNDKCLAPRMASCMIAVDRASKENGCLQVLRGSHLLGRVDHGTAGGQAGADLERVEAAMKTHELVYCEMEPGTALFFHSNLFHRSDQNKSPNSRWSLICCYNSLANVPYKGHGHGRPIPLEIWPDERIFELGRKQAQELEGHAVTK